MEPPHQAPIRRTLTPAVLAATLFTAACAVGAITFVAARGGLQLPLGSAGHCSPSHNCTENSREPKSAKTVCRSDRADDSMEFVVAGDVIVKILSLLDEVQPRNRK